MKKFPIKLVSVLMLALLLGMLTGCGTSTTPADTGKKETTPESALDKIKSAGKISFAMSGKYPPFNFFNDKNELVGFDVEIGQEIAKRIGVKAEPIASEWDGLIAGLLTKKFDMILGSMAITPERLEKVNFSDPYYRSGAQVIVPENSSIKSPADLKGKNVGVVLGTTFETKARELGATVKTYKGDPDNFTDMVNGRLDAVVTDKIVALNAINKNKYNFKLVGDLLYTEKMGIAIRKEDTDTLNAVNKALTDMMADGTYEKISKKWFNADIR